MMMMMMMMTMENVVDDDDDDDDDDVMTTTAKQSSSKISKKKKKKRTTLLFLAIYQRVVSLRRDVFLRLSVYSVCLQERFYNTCVSLVIGLVKDFLGGETSSATTFFVALNWAEKEITRSNTFVLSLSRVEHIYIPLLLEKRDKRERVCVCV